MITAKMLAEAFNRNVQIARMQCEGLSHAESLVQLPFRGNCLNWVIGHLVTNRDNVLKLLGAQDAAAAARMERYRWESEPVTQDGPGVLPLEELLSLLEARQAQIAALLEVITPEDSTRQVAFFGRRSMSVAEWLHFFYFHDTYHTGQTEILRQAAGKDDKII